MHEDPVVPVLLALIIIFIAAQAGAVLADKLKQPLVLGELLAGLVLGNLGFLGLGCFKFIGEDQTVHIFSGIGVIILLFEVGLESNLIEMAAVGLKSFLAAIVGVFTPFVLGYYVSGVIMPDLSDISRIFVGATLTATSVGITARVFKDLKFLKAEESRIVLGAAVIDDVLGLIILAIVSGVAVSGKVDMGTIMNISVKSVGFIVLAIVVGVLLAKRTIKLLSPFKIPGMMLASALTICFLGAYSADQIGLATIVGAFAAGLVLDEVHFKPLNLEKDSGKGIKDYIHPLSLFFVPIFFVLTGMQVDLSVFVNPSIVGAALIITVVAILGKLLCGWSFTSSTKIQRLLIGVGMIPRGEVGLIFALVGKNIGVVDDRLYAITIIMVILTTLVAPPILNFLIKQRKKNNFL